MLPKSKKKKKITLAVAFISHMLKEQQTTY